MCDIQGQGTEHTKAENQLQSRLHWLKETGTKEIPIRDWENHLPALGENLTALKTYLAKANCRSRYAKNIITCLDKAQASLVTELAAGNLDAAGELVQYTLQPLMMYLQQDLYFWLFVSGHEDRMADYRDSQVSALRQVKDNLSALLAGEFRYDVTIAVTAFNKCEYSRLAVESILKHTDFSRYRIELLLIDNGSTDDTLEFFRSVEPARVIHLPEPLGYPATSLGVYGARGKYYIHFANDIVATPHWLEHLLACLSELPDAGMAVPACNYMSSFQSVDAQYQSPLNGTAELDAFARNYHDTHGNAWEERVRLLPCMSIMPAAVARQAVNDSLFYYGEFADDDVSTRLRRAGLRQIFARGTFVHHFGSVTAGKAQHSENSLAVSRKLFREKWGVDAWSSWDWEDELVRVLLPRLTAGPASSLWIDPDFCALPVQARDEFLKQTGHTMQIYGAVTDSRFLPDAGGILDGAVSGTLPQCLSRLTGEVYDAILFRRDISLYMEEGVIEKLLTALKPLLKPAGKVVFYSLNAEVFYPLNQLLQAALAPVHGKHLVPPVSLFPGDVAAAAKKTGYFPEIVPAEKSLTSHIKVMLKQLGSENQDISNRNIFILNNLSKLPEWK